MKDQEFIELLNLYLDHEISEADAARLEAEVQRSPARYRVYREYCQMHKACTLLAPAHAAEAPVVTQLESRSWGWMNPFAVGGLVAAAAAVALVFNRAPTAVPESNAGGVVASVSTPAPAQGSGSVAQSPSQASRSIGQTVTVPVSLGRADRLSGATTQTLRWNTEEAASAVVSDDRFNWIDQLQLTSVSQVPADALRFEHKSTPKDGQRGFGPGPIEGATEYNAIQFQR